MSDFQCTALWWTEDQKVKAALYSLILALNFLRDLFWAFSPLFLHEDFMETDLPWESIKIVRLSIHLIATGRTEVGGAISSHHCLCTFSILFVASVVCRFNSTHSKSGAFCICLKSFFHLNFYIWKCDGLPWRLSGSGWRGEWRNYRGDVQQGWKC